MSLELQELTFGYESDAPILLGISHRFSPGSLTALTGPSGSGKSTLLYLAGLMLTPEAGRVLVDGQDASAWSDGERTAVRAERMGFVFQDALLDPARSIVDNVCEGSLYHSGRRRGVRERARELLDHYGVTADPLRRPGQISGGQAQRVALCRALIGRPDIILADEPTGNLDHESADIVWTTLAQLATDGATVLVATHDQHRAAACHHHFRVGHASTS